MFIMVPHGSKSPFSLSLAGRLHLGSLFKTISPSWTEGAFKQHLGLFFVVMLLLARLCGLM